MYAKFGGWFGLVLVGWFGFVFFSSLYIASYSLCGSLQVERVHFLSVKTLLVV